MTILMDDDEHKHPTFLNITEAFKALSEQSQPGDAVFIQFSGHGGRVLDAPIDARHGRPPDAGRGPAVHRRPASDDDQVAPERAARAAVGQEPWHLNYWDWKAKDIKPCFYRVVLALNFLW